MSRRKPRQRKNPIQDIRKPQATKDHILSWRQAIACVVIIIWVAILLGAIIQRPAKADSNDMTVRQWQQLNNCIRSAFYMTVENEKGQPAIVQYIYLRTIAEECIKTSTQQDTDKEDKAYHF